MAIPLPKGVIFAYSLPADIEASVTVEVVGAGAVDYAPPSAAGGFGEPAGTLAAGESIELDAPGMLRSPEGSEVTLTYSDPPPAET
jgi:hypothetical protein